MKRLALLGLTLGLLVCGSALAEEPATPVGPQRLIMQDQFANKQDTAAYRGQILVLIYGDRKSADANRQLGEWVHVQFHPGAQGLPPAEARRAPVRPLLGVAPGMPVPDVLAIPVACTGYVPKFVRSFIRGQISRASPDVPVWLDFKNQMRKKYGMAPGVPNLIVLDARGHLRYTGSGNLTTEHRNQMIDAIEGLRREAVQADTQAILPASDGK